MKKIVCPHCQKVNYDAFASYPYCAQCGNQLPNTTDPDQISIWKRPVGTLVWAGLLGVVAVALAAAAILLRAPKVNNAQLLVYGTVQRHLHINSQTVMHLTLDSVESNKLLSNSRLTQVELRIPRKLLKDWTLVSMEPKAKDSYTRGNGTYFQLGSMPLNTTLFLTWRAHKAGEYRMNVSIFAKNYNPIRYQTIVTVDKKAE